MCAWSWGTTDALCSSELTILVVGLRMRKGHLKCRRKGKEWDPRPCLPSARKPHRAGQSKLKKPETDTQSVHITSSPSKEQAREQIRDSSHSPVSHLMIWNYDKARIKLSGVWLDFSVQVCPIRLDTLLCIFPLPLQQSTLFPHAAEIQYVKEILFFFFSLNNW